MAFKKSKKGAMLNSGLSIAICSAMLIGGTFAWFTDTASTGKNTIKTGTLDVTLTRDGKSLEGVDNIFMLEGGDEYLQPGEKITTGKMLVKNEGNTPFNYRLNIGVMPIDGVMPIEENNLLNFMNVKVNGENRGSIQGYTAYLNPGEYHEVVVEIEMNNEAGNEYQGITLSDFRIEVEASQGELESYEIDKDTDVSKVVEDMLKEETLPTKVAFDVSSVGQMNFDAIRANLSKLVEKGAKEIVIEGNNLGARGNQTVVTFGGSAGDRVIAPEGSTLVFKNVAIENPVPLYNANDPWEHCNLDMRGNFRFDNVTFDCGVQMEGTNATFTGCTFNEIIVDGEHKTNRYAAWISNGNATFEGCTFKSARNIKVHEKYGSKVDKVVVNNCTFTGTVKPAVAIGTVDKDTTIHITNNRVNKNANTEQSGKAGIYETDTDIKNFDFKQENNN